MNISDKCCYTCQFVVLVLNPMKSRPMWGCTVDMYAKNEETSLRKIEIVECDYTCPLWNKRQFTSKDIARMVEWQIEDACNPSPLTYSDLWELYER